jgi:glycosyltransferase involved in cell wall biosynthesis
MNQQPHRPHRLLMVTYHFPPSGAVATYRMLGFARHLPQHGWRVGVVAPPRLPGEPVDEALLQRVPPETAIFSAPYPQSLPARLARRWFPYGVWLPRALAVATDAIAEFQPDAVLTSGPPHCVQLLGLLLKRFYRLPWVACFRDPWCVNTPTAPDPSAAGTKAWRRAAWVKWARRDRYWENRVFLAADCILANTPRGCEGLKKAHPRLSHKIVCVTNGFDPELFPPPMPRAPRDDLLTILHAGELYYGRDPRPFLDALRSLENARVASHLPIRLRILGQGTDTRLDLPAAIKERGLDNLVEIGGQVPYSQALDAMTSADMLLLLDTPKRKIGIPAKLFEYLGAARPILALAEADGDLAWALRTSGMPHRIAPPLDAAKIYQALLELREDICHERCALPSPERLETFTRANIARQLAEHLDRIVLNQHEAPPSSNANHARERVQCAPASRRPHYAGA